MSGERDKDTLRRLDDLERWRRRIDDLISKGKGFWLAMAMIGGGVVLFVTAAWEVATHYVKPSGG